MPRCLECEAPATHQRRCESHWKAHRARPGVKARERRTEALRDGQNAAQRLRRQMRKAFAKEGIKPQCAICTGAFLPSGIDIDHIIPLARGGEDVDGNVRPLCKSCHRDVTRAVFYPDAVPF